MPDQLEAFMVSTPPLRLTERIPADLPLVVHHNVRKRLLVYGSAYFAWCLVLLGPAALLVPTTAGRGVIAVVVAGGCLVPVVGFLLGVYLWALASRGPVLAAGPDGMGSNAGRCPCGRSGCRGSRSSW
ncbi:hypothetical protein ACFQX7_31940 [Luedemannella flava]